MKAAPFLLLVVCAASLAQTRVSDVDVSRLQVYRFPSIQSDGLGTFEIPRAKRLESQVVQDQIWSKYIDASNAVGADKTKRSQLINEAVSKLAEEAVRSYAAEGRIDIGIVAWMDHYKKQSNDNTKAVDQWYRDLVTKRLDANTKVYMPGGVKLPVLPEPQTFDWTKFRFNDETRQVTVPGTPRPRGIKPPDKHATIAPKIGGPGGGGGGGLWRYRRPEYFNPLQFLEVVKISGAKAERTCTGTLVSKIHVLTAAHCVDDWRKNPVVVRVPHRDPAQEKRCIDAAEKHGEYIRCTKLVPARVAANGIDIHPGWVKDPLNSDAALITLDEPMRHVAPAKVSFDSIPDKVTIAGYGISNVGFKAPDNFHPLDLDDRLEVGWSGGEVLKTPTRISWYVDGSSLTASGTCSGDSGGPVFSGTIYGADNERRPRKLIAVATSGATRQCLSYRVNQTLLAAPSMRSWLCQSVCRR